MRHPHILPRSSRPQSAPASLRRPLLIWSSTLVLVLGSLLVEPIPRLLAAVTSAGLRAAGFGAADGANKGEKITAANERKAVTDAIDKLAETPGSEDCVKCLREMFKNDRICKEAGTSTAGATTLPDKKAGCDPKAEAINLHPDFAKWPVETLACALAHEWCHTNQTDFSGNFEKPCYQLEVDCLKALGQDQPGKPAKARYDQMVCCLAELSRTDRVNASGRAPLAGGRVRMHRDSSYSVFSSQAPDVFWSIPPGHQSTIGYRIRELTIAFDFALLDNVLGGKTVALITGRDVPRNVGIVQAVLIEDGIAKSVVSTLELPGVEPFGIAHDPVRAVTYLLDTQNDQVLRLVDTNSDGVPDAPASVPFATSATFGFLSQALSLTLNVGANVPSLFVDAEDGRGIDVLRVDVPRTLLFDENTDGRADRSAVITWRDLIALMPGYLGTPLAGQTMVEVFAGAGVRVQVQLTDSTGSNNLGVLGNATVPAGNNEVVVSLSAMLQSGTFIRTLDLDNPQVGSFPFAIATMDNGSLAFFGKACAHGKGTPDIGFGGAPVIGNERAAITGAGLIANQLAALAIGTPAATPFPLAPIGGIPGSELLVDLILALPVPTDASGGVSLPVPVPLDRALIGAEISFQLFDPDWSLSYVMPLGHSRGMTVKVGG